MSTEEPTPIAQREGVVLRVAGEADLPAIDEITVICYTPIHESFVSVLGESCYQGLYHTPDVDWQVRKTGRVRATFRDHPGCLWVLEEDGVIFGFISFHPFPQNSRAWIEENGVLPERRGQGWATFMLRHVLHHLRRQGIRFASVEVDLDEVHGPARRVYQKTGFDRHHRIAIYHQDLHQANPGSLPDPPSPENP